MRFVFNILHYFRAFWAWRIRKSSQLSYPPHEIALEATNVCNFRCNFCPQSDPIHHDLVPQTYLTIEQAEQILGKLRRGGVTTRTLHWTIDGEAFMNKAFPELCRVAVANDFDNMFFSTNGSLCTPERLSLLPSTARYTLAIDYCSDQVYFETVRGRPGSWARIRDNVRAILTDPQWTNIYVHMTDISSYGIADPSELKARLALLRSLFGDHPRLRIRTKTFHNATGLVDAPGADASMPPTNICPYPWTSLMVAANGDVIACCRDLRHQTVLGNLLRQELAEIWNGAPYRSMRRHLSAMEPHAVDACRGCDMPRSTDKFALRNLFKTAAGRFQIFDS